MHYQSQTLSIDWKIRFTTRTSGQVKHIESTGRVFEWKMHLIFVSDVRVGQNYCGFFKILKTETWANVQLMCMYIYPVFFHLFSNRQPINLSF